MDNERIAANVLKHCELFQDFSPSDIQRMVQYLDIRTGQEGDVLFFEGETSDAMYIVSQGKLELLMNDERGQPRLVGWVGPAESFGEMGLLTRGARMLTVRATNNVALYELSLESFMQIRIQHPDICLLLVMSAVKRFSGILSSSQELIRRVMLTQLNQGS